MIVSDSDWHVLFLVIIQNLTRFQAVFQYLGKKTFPDFRFFFFFFCINKTAVAFPGCDNCKYKLFL